MTDFVEPWESTLDRQHRKHFETELQREVANNPRHVLYGRSMVALAGRADRDDVLFEIDGGPTVAVIHLTYSPETQPQWPNTEFYESLSDFRDKRMQRDHEEYSL